MNSDILVRHPARRPFLGQSYDFSVADHLAQTDSNPGFGAYKAATRTVDTTRSHSGTQSMKATWPALAAAPAGETRPEASWVNFQSETLNVGDSLRIQAWVYVPTGSPPVFADVIFYGTSLPMATKDQWTEIDFTYTHVGETPIEHAFAGLGVYGPITGGQSMWVDDVRITRYTGALLRRIAGR